jgi:hypothetical protein
MSDTLCDLRRDRRAKTRVPHSGDDRPAGVPHSENSPHSTPDANYANCMQIRLFMHTDRLLLNSANLSV